MKVVDVIKEAQPAIATTPNDSPFPSPSYEIVELGGVTHYSQEMRAYLARIPREQAERIVAEIEWRNRPRRIIRWL